MLLYFRCCIGCDYEAVFVCALQMLKDALVSSDVGEIKLFETVASQNDSVFEALKTLRHLLVEML